eukprot:1119270-Prorocentrum_minimum.AAC.1
MGMGVNGVWLTIAVSTIAKGVLKGILFHRETRPMADDECVVAGEESFTKEITELTGDVLPATSKSQDDGEEGK